jgi:hypothetical protein
MQWLAFLHFYFLMLCACTTASLAYLAWLVWPRP